MSYYAETCSSVCLDITIKLPFWRICWFSMRIYILCTSPLIECYTEGDFVPSRPFYSFSYPEVMQEKTVKCKVLMQVTLC
jgi:hypothetical protein